jgi:8-oxo-dGTP pyrophosphatase MutT (NUDIX family)
VTTPALREAARAIVLDPDDRVMLLRYDENGGFWATPGGSLEPGETHRQAVVRELREELGVQHVTLGPHRQLIRVPIRVPADSGAPFRRRTCRTWRN